MNRVNQKQLARIVKHLREIVKPLATNRPMSLVLVMIGPASPPRRAAILDRLRSELEAIGAHLAVAHLSAESPDALQALQSMSERIGSAAVIALDGLSERVSEAVDPFAALLADLEAGGRQVPNPVLALVQPSDLQLAPFKRLMSRATARFYLLSASDEALTEESAVPSPSINAAEAGAAAVSRSADPVAWAVAQRALADVLLAAPPTHALQAFEAQVQRAIDCLGAALEELKEDEHPAEWARAQRSLAAAYAFPVGKTHERRLRRLACFESAERGFRAAGLTAKAEQMLSWIDLVRAQVVDSS